MTIKYLVLGGGGVGGLMQLGVLRNLEKKNLFSLKNLKSIYGTSVGTILGTLLILTTDFTTLEDYLIKRPWEKIFNIKPDNIWRIIESKGMLNMEIIIKMIEPFLEINNLSINITLKEFYEFRPIQFYLYTVNINEEHPTITELSSKTHPDLELCKAIAMSSSIPIIFAPIYYEDGCYIDGSFLNDFPLNECLMNEKELKEWEVLGISISSKKGINKIEEDTKLHNFLFYLFNKMRYMVRKRECSKIQNIIDCYSEKNNIEKWVGISKDENKRREMINLGEEIAENKFKELHLQNPSDV